MEIHPVMHRFLQIISAFLVSMIFLPLHAEETAKPLKVSPSQEEASAEISPVAIGPMQGLFPYWQRYQDLAPKDRSRFLYTFYLERDDDKPVETTPLWYMWEGEAVPISIMADGRVDFMVEKQVYTSNPLMWSRPSFHEATGEKVNLSLRGVLDMSVPLARSMEVAVLRTALDQVTASFKIMLGLKGLITQGPQWIAFYFDGPAPKAEAVFPDGGRVSLLVEGHKVYFRPKDKRWKGAARLEFGEKPAFARFE